MSILSIIAIVGAVLVLLVVAYFIYSGIAINRQYEQLMSAKHISEVSNALVELKEKAMAQGRPNDESELLEQNSFVSSVGMALLYSIEKRDDGSAYHHLSISKGGNVLAHSFQLTMASWVAQILAIEPELVMAPHIAGRSPQIRHIFFELGPERQAQFESTAVNSYGESEVAELYKSVIMKRDAIQENSRKVMSSSNSSTFQP